MAKKIFDKITSSNSALMSSDLTADEKKQLYAHMAKFDMTESKCYKRFFDKGFAMWEILGVENILRQFLEEHKDKLVKSGKDGDRGYAYVLSLTKETSYAAIREAGLLSTFIRHMETLGMCGNTVYKRFQNPDWKAYELRGIKSILSTFNP